jgi:putative ABC transport system permease protein
VDYRFAGDPTSAQLRSSVNRLRASLPAGSITASTDYLAVARDYNTLDQLIADLLLAFSTIALVATVAIVANLVTGIVIAAYREIGIMKAVGFTPRQVELAFVLQILIPVAAAAGVAIPLGTLASQPLLAESAHALGITYQPTFSPALDAVAFVGALVIVAAAALVPALRAGRLKPAEVIAKGSAPRGRSGSFMRGLATRAGLPRPIAFGIGDAFARPLRAGLTLLAIFVGVTAATVAVAVPRSFTLVQATMTTGKADVVVQRSPALTDAEAVRIIDADSRTAHVVGELDQNLAVPGISDPIPARIFRGDTSRLGFVLVSGRWFERPGEVVAPRKLIHDAHLTVGDHFTAMVGSKPVSLVLVGELFDVSNFGYSLSTDAATVSAAEPDAAPETYLVTVTRGANVDAYVRRVGAARPDLLDVQRNSIDTNGSSAGVVQTVLAIVAAVIAAIGVVAIFNTLLLNTRERVRDIAVLKAIGMSPKQVSAMVAASAAPLALVAGLLGAPAGVGVNHLFLTLLLGGVGGNDTPPAIYAVFTPWQLVAIPLAGAAVAVIAALIPGHWAARTNVVAALQAE